ncbi:hypothetical protein H0H92_009773 [Tricholoma furcatifolium]|nr:hypothetical protein H0H92_009773 [Tricholoma furcatifolium]
MDMTSTEPSSRMFLHFDPNKIPVPTFLGGSAPHPVSSLPGSSSCGVKRKRDEDPSTAPLNPSILEQAAETADGNEENHTVKKNVHKPVGKDRMRTFENRDGLIEALSDSFKESHDVDFAASFRTHDPGVSHKQRIKALTHEVWKVTGYRFTIKDHPYTKEGHKTRLWCSQDEAHKNKASSKVPNAPRVTSDGVILAKARYACRSSLLISSRDDGEPGVANVIVRMHHHLAHEPYYDHTLPPEMTQPIWEQVPRPINPQPVIPSSAALTLVTDLGDNSVDGSSSEEDTVTFMEHALDAAKEDGVPTEEQRFIIDLTQDETSSTLHLDSHHSLTPAIFRQRMVKHIADIREFCCGLEYQLQFNDYKLLQVLESEGSQFLKLVHSCLEMEDRLRKKDGDDKLGQEVRH